MAAAAVIFSCGKEKQPEDNNEDPEDVQEEETIEVTSITLRKTNIEMDITLTEGKIIEVISTTPSVNEDYLNAEIITGDDVISLERDERGWRAKPKKLGTAKVKITPQRGGASVECTVTVSEGNVADAVPITKLSCSQKSFTLKDLDESGYSIGPDKVTVAFNIEPAEAVFGADINVTVDREDVLGVEMDGHNLTILSMPNTSHKPSETGTFNVYVKPKKGSARSVTLKVEVTGHVYGIQLGLFDSPSTDWKVKDELKTIILVENVKLDLKPRILATDRRKYDIAESADLFLSTGKNKVGSWEKADYSYGTVSPNGILVAGSHFTAAMGDQKLYLVTAPKGSGISAVGYPVEVYQAIKQFSLNSDVTENTPVLNGQFTISLENWPPINYTRPDFEVEYDKNYLSLVSQDGGHYTFKCIKATSTILTKLKAYPVGRKELLDEVSFHINQFAPSDRKPGDFVYWNSTLGFYASDGGLRYYDQYGDFRQDDVKPFETDLIGVIMEELSAENMTAIKKVHNVTYAGVNNKHFRIMSIHNVGGQTKWSSSNDKSSDILSIWQNDMNGDYGNPPYDRAFQRNGYADEIQVSKGWEKYNAIVTAKSQSKRVICAVEDLAEFGETNGSSWLKPLPIDKTRCSGGILPLNNVTPGAAPAYDFKARKIVDRSLHNCGSLAQDLNQDFWLSRYTEGETVYYAYIAYNNGGEDERPREQVYPVRPILYL